MSKRGDNAGHGTVDLLTPGKIIKTDRKWTEYSKK